MYNNNTLMSQIVQELLFFVQTFELHCVFN